MNIPKTDQYEITYSILESPFHIAVQDQAQKWEIPTHELVVSHIGLNFLLISLFKGEIPET